MRRKKRVRIKHIFEAITRYADEVTVAIDKRESAEAIKQRAANCCASIITLAEAGTKELEGEDE